MLDSRFAQIGRDDNLQYVIAMMPARQRREIIQEWVLRCSGTEKHALLRPQPFIESKGVHWSHQPDVRWLEEESLNYGFILLGEHLLHSLDVGSALFTASK